MKLKSFHCRFMRQLMKLADQFGIAVVITNQVRDYRMTIWNLDSGYQSYCEIDVSWIGTIGWEQFKLIRSAPVGYKIYATSNYFEINKNVASATTNQVKYYRSVLAEIRLFCLIANVFHELVIFGRDQFNTIASMIFGYNNYFIAGCIASGRRGDVPGRCKETHWRTYRSPC